MVKPARVKNQSNNQVSHRITAVSQKHYSGPLPHPDFIREYNDILPGSGQIILDTFQKQTNHRIELENKAVDASIKRGFRGQTYGFIIGMTGLIVGGLCAYFGSDITGSVVGGGSVVALVTVFVVGKKAQSKELEDKK